MSADPADPVAQLAALRADLEDVKSRLLRMESALSWAGLGRGAPCTEPSTASSMAPSTGSIDLPRTDVGQPAPYPGRILAGASEGVGAVAWGGRLLLVLAGAYLLRSLTESGTLPLVAGVAAGLGYAALWLGVADRAARAGRRAGAVALGCSGVLLAYPLLFESATRFGLLSPTWAALALALVAFAGLWVAARHDLPALAWTVGVGAAAVGSVLLVREGGALPGAALFVALGLAGTWAGLERGWLWLPWAAAALADLGVAFLSTVALDGRTPPSAAAVVMVELSLAVGFLAVILRRVLGRKAVTTAFAVVQSLAALGLGYRGALAVATAQGTGAAALGLVGLLAAVLGYAVAFGIVGRAERARFLLVTTLALALVLLGSAAVLGSPVLPWCVLAVGTSWAGSRTGRVTLGIHGAAYALAAALASGLLWQTGQTWGAGCGALPGAPTAGALAALLACSVSALLPLPTDLPFWRGSALAPRVVTAAVAVLAIGALAVRALVPLLPGTSSAGSDAATLSALRTGVLAALALGAALVARGARPSPARWLVHPLLALGLVKLLVEDLPRGCPATQWVSLLLYGGAVIAAPRLARARAARSLPPEASPSAA